MKTKILAISSLGMLLGYLSGYNLAYSGALIKLCILVIFISILFIKKAKQDLFFRKFLILISIFILFFIVSSVRGNILKKDFINIQEKVSIHIKVYDTLIKDDTQILKAEVISLDETQKEKTHTSSLEQSDKLIIFYKNNLEARNIAIYTFSQEKYIPGTILLLEAKIQNELIILPKKESETYFQQNNGKSFDLLKYWNTRNIGFVSMYPKIKIISQEDYNISQNLILKSKNTPQSKNFTKLKDEIQDNIYLYSYRFRNYFSTSLQRTVDNFDTGIIMAMLWGDENGLSKDTNNVFRNTGTSHILVLSGYNLVIVAGLTFFLFRKLPLKKKIIISIIFIIIFLLLAHTSAPVWRASVMSLYTMLTIFLLKEADAKFALWLTCFIFLIYSPSIAMYDISFHLSFLATLSIIYFYSELETLIKNKFFTKNKKEKITEMTSEHTKEKQSKFLLEDKKIFDVERYKRWENIISVFLVTVSANILIAPYIVFQFGYFKFSSILLSILITPFVPIVMFLGFVIGSINMIINFLFSFDLFILNIFGEVIYLISKMFSFILEFIVSGIFNFLKLFSESNLSISSPISFSILTILYIIIFIIYSYLKFVNKNTL